MWIGDGDCMGRRLVEYYLMVFGYGDLVEGIEDIAIAEVDVAGCQNSEGAYETAPAHSVEHCGPVPSGNLKSSIIHRIFEDGSNTLRIRSVVSTRILLGWRPRLRIAWAAVPIL